MRRAALVLVVLAAVLPAAARAQPPVGIVRPNNEAGLTPAQLGVADTGFAYAATRPVLDTGSPAASTQPAAASDTLVLHLSEDAYKGDARFTVSIDGKTLDTAEAVTALHASGASRDFTFTGSLGAGPHDVGVSFLNDAWGGTAATDRNLYVDSASFDGRSYAGATLLSNGTAHFTVSA